MGRERREGVKKKSFPYLINIPIAVYLICVLFGPMIWGIGLSFTNKAIGGTGNFIGFTNYIKLLKDPTYTNINKLAFQYADGIIFNHKDVDDELRTFATDLKKPTLEYPGEQSYIEAYSDFFDKIIE